MLSSETSLSEAYVLNCRELLFAIGFPCNFIFPLYLRQKSPTDSYKQF